MFKVVIMVAAVVAGNKMFSVPVQKTQLGHPVTSIQKKTSSGRRIIQMKRKAILKNAPQNGNSTNSTIPLQNMENFSYVGPVMFGTSSPMQGSNTSGFVYDTGSGYLTV